MRSLRTAAAALAVAAITLSACSSAATTAPTVAPASAAPSAAAPSVAASSAPSTAPASSAPSAAPSAAVIPIPSGGVLTFAGKLVICSDIPYPPLEYFDPNGNPIGSDIEIGQEIAKRLGLTAEIQNSVFDTIIPALIGNKCDIIISDQNITADRVKQVDMIPYFQAGQSFVVAVGNPAGINTTDDLCGKKVGAETGTTEVDYLTKTLSPACTKKGLAAITSKTFGKDSDALLALQSGQVDAYFADTPPAAYYTIQHPDQFVLAPIAPLAPAFAGISVLKSNTGLRDAIQQALVAMANDGTYLAILKKYAVDSGALTTSDMMTVNKIQ
jgi:polar amino acid transport system substrate-binding protein